MWPNPLFPADLVTFTEEILNGKLYFLCSVNQWVYYIAGLEDGKVQHTALLYALGKAGIGLINEEPLTVTLSSLQKISLRELEINNAR